MAKVYAEKASGATADRPALKEMIADLQPGDVVIAEHIDRISRLPLPDAELLIAMIKEKQAQLSIPGILDLSQLDARSDIERIVLEAVQSLLLKIALSQARDDYLLRRNRQREGIEKAKTNGKYKGRAPNYDLHRKIFILRNTGMTIADVAKLCGCGVSTVNLVMKTYDAVDDIPNP